MKFKNRAERNGYVFGNVCKFFGTLFGIFGLFVVPNERTIINFRALIVTTVFLSIAYYGLWRTGGKT